MLRSAIRAFLTGAAALVSMIVPLRAQPAPGDARVADIVQAGKLRVGLHLPQFVEGPDGRIVGRGTGTVIVQIVQALSDRIGVQLVLVGHSAPPGVVGCLKDGRCDLGVLGYDPQRSKDVDYATPHVIVPFTFLVAPGSALKAIADVDRPAIRIAVVRAHVSTLTLMRQFKHAQMIEVGVPDEAFELVRTGRADAYASPRPPILEYAERLPGSRVLDGRYGANIQAIALAKGRDDRRAYVDAFIAFAKASGLIQAAIERAGERGIEVAAPGILKPVQ